QAVSQQGRRQHDLSVRSEPPVRLLLRAHSALRRGIARRPAGRLRPGDCVRWHVRKRIARNAAPALRDLRAHTGTTVVEGDGDRSVLGLRKLNEGKPSLIPKMQTTKGRRTTKARSSRRARRAHFLILLWCLSLSDLRVLRVSCVFVIFVCFVFGF